MSHRGFYFTFLIGLFAFRVPAESLEHFKWNLWRSGTQLRGANIWQKVIDPSQSADGNSLGDGTVGPPFVQDDFDKLASWGANYVNLSVPGIFSEFPPYRFLPKVAYNLDQLIEKASKAGLFIVISYRTGPGRSEDSFAEGQRATNDEVWTRPEAQAAWAAMWRYTAAHYRGNRNIVGYNLMVEPNANEGVCGGIDSPIEFTYRYAGTTCDWSLLALKISWAIRSVDLGTPIIISPLNYADANWLPALRYTGDYHTLYAIHFYEPSTYSHTPDDPQAPVYPGPLGDGVGVDKNWLDDKLTPVDNFRKAHPWTPIAVNEFGVVRWQGGADRYFTDLTDLFEKRGLSHAIWLWEPKFKLGWDDFNFQYGSSPVKHEPAPTSQMIEAIRNNWTRNTVHPMPR